MQHTLACLREDLGPHKLVKQFIEELAKKKNYCLDIAQVLSKLRSHLRRHGDAQINIFNMKTKISTFAQQKKDERASETR